MNGESGPSKVAEPDQVNSESLPSSAVSNSNNPSPSAVHLLQTELLPNTGPSDGDILLIPQVSAVRLSLPRYYSLTTARPVRLTQGTRLGTVTPVDEIYTTETSRTVPLNPVIAGNTDPIETDFWEDSEEAVDFNWEEDLFDQMHGLEDFGYDDELDLCRGTTPVIGTCCS